MFGWNESGQLAQPTNLAKPAECFSAVEKLLMACCTMQPEDAALPRGDAEDCEVYHKNDDKESSVVIEPSEIEKDTLSCYTTTACNTDTDLVVVQALPMLVTVPGGKDEGSQALDVSCGSRHTVVLTKANVLWAFGWNKYGQNILVNNRIVVKCMVCPDIELCPDCFAGRADIGIHHPSHAYKLIDNSGFTLFKTDWTAK